MARADMAPDKRECRIGKEQGAASSEDAEWELCHRAAPRDGGRATTAHVPCVFEGDSVPTIRRSVKRSQRPWCVDMPPALRCEGRPHDDRGGSPSRDRPARYPLFYPRYTWHCDGKTMCRRGWATSCPGGNAGGRRRPGRRGASRRGPTTTQRWADRLPYDVQQAPVYAIDLQPWELRHGSRWQIWPDGISPPQRCALKRLMCSPAAAPMVVRELWHAQGELFGDDPAGRVSANPLGGSEVFHVMKCTSREQQQ